MPKTPDNSPTKKKARQRILQAASESFQTLGDARTTAQAIASKADRGGQLQPVKLQVTAQSFISMLSEFILSEICSLPRFPMKK